MQKILIIQVEVGGTGGYVYNPDVSPDAKAASKLFDKLTYTVERYCKTHGYDYKKITEYPKKVGQHKQKDVMLHIGPYGTYMKYDNKNYRIDKLKDHSLSSLSKLLK